MQRRTFLATGSAVAACSLAAPLAFAQGTKPVPIKFTLDFRINGQTAPFFLALLGMVVVYLVLVEVAKAWFFAREAHAVRPPLPAAPRKRAAGHHIARRAARFSTPQRFPSARPRRRNATRSAARR